MWQRKPTGGRALKVVTTAVSPNVLALRSEQGRDIYPRVATQPEKGTHHGVKRPDQAGIRGPARGPTHLHPTRDNTVNPANNSLLCGGGPGSRAKKWAANNGKWPTPRHPLHPTPPRTHTHPTPPIRWRGTSPCTAKA